MTEGTWAWLLKPWHWLAEGSKATGVAQGKVFLNDCEQNMPTDHGEQWHE